MGDNGNGNQSQPGSGQSVPWLFGTSPYKGVRDYFDSEDVIAAMSLPALNALMGGAFSGKEALKGFINQIVARNGVDWLLTGQINPITRHSLKCLVAGGLLPIEDYILMSRRGGGESFYRKMSKATLASLVASAVGPAVGQTMPDYT
jgi:hypothetical protein